MLRRLMLALFALGIGLFAASLLRSERRAAAGERARPDKGAGCAARTRSGAACSRPARPGSEFCWQHG